MFTRASATRRLQVHAWLDVACPWCWIAKRRFEEAISEFGGEVDVEYHSFELAPDLPADYRSTEADFLQRLYTISANDAAMRIRLVTSTGARLGLAYDYDTVQHTSTFLAHQLLHHAKAHGLQHPLLDALRESALDILHRTPMLNARSPSRSGDHHVRPARRLHPRRPRPPPLPR